MNDDTEAILASVAAIAMGLVENYFAKKEGRKERSYPGVDVRARKKAARKKREPTLHEMLADLD